MRETDWGRKHVCTECQAPFYDMRREPITCPKCGAKHQPVALLKSDGRPPRRNRLRPTIVATAPAEPEEKAAPDDPEAPDDDADDDVDDDGDDEAKAVDAESGR
jgi:hypothetical protein